MEFDLHFSCCRGNWESEDLLSIVFQDAQNGWITGDDNVLLATTDGGATWTNQRIILSDRGHDINDITVLGNGHIIAVAVNGGILH